VFENAFGLAVKPSDTPHLSRKALNYVWKDRNGEWHNMGRAQKDVVDLWTVDSDDDDDA
jgi:hypothetical protein